MPPILTITSTMAMQCQWLKDVLARTSKYLEAKDADGQSAFLSSVLVPVIVRVLNKSAGSAVDWKPYAIMIEGEAKNMFDNLEVLVSFNGISGPGSFAQAATDGSQIFVQASWAAVADALRIRAARDNYFTTHYDYQLAVGVLQILHELAHCFLPAILMLDYRLQIVRNVPEPIKLHAIPVKMGSEFSEETGKTKGGVGFELEVILTGVGRVYPEFSNYWEISGIHTFTEENISTNRTCKVIVSNQRAWAGRIARSSNPMISDFILETVKNTKKRGRNSAEEREEDLSDGSKTNMRVDARGMIYSCDSEDSGGEDCDEAQLWAEQGLIEKVASGFKSRN